MSDIFDMPEMDEIDVDTVDADSSVVPDVGNMAIKMAFVGTGQGGCNLVAKFHQLGYGRVLALNTTEQDVSGLNVPHKYIMPVGGGAGKDPRKGEQAVVQYREEIMSQFRTAFGEDFEHIIICLGSGGGTGSGSVFELIDIAKEYLRTLGREDVDVSVGVLCALPKPNEGARVNANAHHVVTGLCELAENGLISPLVLSDNDRIGKLYPKVSVKDFFEVANRNICAHFDIFNRLAAQHSSYATFDVADYRSILRSGILMFGHTRITKFEREAEISDCIRHNLDKGLFCDGFDLSTATTAAGVLVAAESILGVLPESHIDLAFNTLCRLLSPKGTTLHRGIYETNKDALFLYTIIGALKEPKQRVAQLEKIGGLA